MMMCELHMALIHTTVLQTDKSAGFGYIQAYEIISVVSRSWSSNENEMHPYLYKNTILKYNMKKKIYCLVNYGLTQHMDIFVYYWFIVPYNALIQNFSRGFKL